MNERRLQFAVGLMVLVAMSIGSALVIRFGDLSREFQDRYQLLVHLESAGGLYPSAPVLMSGLSIGSVKSLEFDPDGGVLVTVDIRQEVKLRNDSVPIVARSLLGETAIEFVPGRTGDFLPPGSRVKGQSASDPMAAIARLETRAVTVLDAFAATSREWQQVAANVNSLMQKHEGQLDIVIERAAQSLQQFTVTMQSANQMLVEANKIVADPRAQQAMRETLVALPRLVNETQATITATRGAVENINRNLINLAQVTEPVGQRGPVLVARLESSLTSLDSLLGELNQLAHAVNTPNGSVQKFAADPALYENLNRSAQSLAILLKNLDPVLTDLREFSDKIARNPELLGVGGAMRPSSGLRDTDLLQQQPAAQQAPRTPTPSRATFRSQN
uniref:MCE family protein n=1 Tax=Schlesneria paludicola TaxID=360056 RepID=A0A7C2P0P5_9PLAN